jgi:hypothetical protein
MLVKRFDPVTDQLKVDVQKRRRCRVASSPPRVTTHDGTRTHQAARVPGRRTQSSRCRLSVYLPSPGPSSAVLRDACTTYCVDRRAFDVSGDAPRYRIERVFEDVAAPVDAAAARTGAPGRPVGHSSGAYCVIGGAALSETATSCSTNRA